MLPGIPREEYQALMPTASAPQEKDFLISYSQADKPWAEWIAWTLETNGYSTIIEAWDFRPGDNHVLALQRAVSASTRTLALLSPSYLASGSTQQVWASAFGKDPTGSGRLLPLRVAACDAPGLLGPIISRDLFGLDEVEAARTLLEAVSQERARPPRRPPFPGAPRPLGEPPPYPGESSSRVRAVGPSHEAPTDREPLPGPPRHCFGRGRELEEIVQMLLADEVLPIPILGPGGIGKSTLSRAALHAPRVKQRFQGRRYFVNCETSQTVEALVEKMARAIGVPSGPHLRERVLSELAREPALLVLDNLETPWWADEEGTEAFLENLGATPSLALMATIRGESWPLHPNWRTPPIELQPLDKEAARETFLATARRSVEMDPHLDNLLEEVARVPLAIELLAYVSRTDSDLRDIWESWQRSRTALLQRGTGANRLSSMEFSYELSIGSHKMTPQARRLLSLLALLPDGLARHHQEEFHWDIDPYAAARTLRLVGLAHQDDQRLRMLAPLREYVRVHHPPEDSVLNAFINYFATMAAQLGSRIGYEGGEDSIRRLTDERANIESMILQGLEREDPQPAIDAILALRNFMRFSGLGNPRIMEKARDAAHRKGKTLDEANCIRIMGDIALARSQHDEALRHYSRALVLYAQIPEPYSIGRANLKLAGSTPDPNDQLRHLRAARDAWTSIGRHDLIRSYIYMFREIDVTLE
jgi:hypothetical protein